MTALAPAPAPEILSGAAAVAARADWGRRLRQGGAVPYLGPGLLPPDAPVPTTPEALAGQFGARVALPRRAKGNAWAAAQHIESTRHRRTLSALMAEAFAAPVVPTAGHRGLAALGLPLIVDSWYDGAMRTALTGRADWGEVQGITRAGPGEDQWYRFYDAGGARVDADAAAGWRTLLYKPHGSVVPAGNFLISDSDYVETLTEIDIQTPIPPEVRDRRQGRDFLFLGCRFHDQLLRSYARQIGKRSGERPAALLDPEQLSRNEMRFLAGLGVTAISLPSDQALDVLFGAA
ncbi:MAG: SIR2 family protein [Telmatospirillum sp.]|nr:SIR2 family protein [Telmatospirillum sp.]